SARQRPAMGILLKLSTLALRHLIENARKAWGLEASELADGVIEVATRKLLRHFTDHSQKLTRALKRANERAWKALDVALAGESFWERCRLFVASGDERAFRQQLRAFLEVAPLPPLEARAGLRQ